MDYYYYKYIKLPNTPPHIINFYRLSADSSSAAITWKLKCKIRKINIKRHKKEKTVICKQLFKILAENNICKTRLVQIVGNKAKERILKRVFPEIKHAKFSEKRTFLTYQKVNVRFPENLACFVFLKHPFWDLPFCLIADEMTYSIPH